VVSACRSFAVPVTPYTAHIKLSAELTLEIPRQEDYSRSAEILRQYSDAKVDFVDTMIVAIAERLNITRVLTLDRRDFQLIRPKHCSGFEILP
jgi:uncharacterized protein